MKKVKKIILEYFDDLTLKFETLTFTEFKQEPYTLFMGSYTDKFISKTDKTDFIINFDNLKKDFSNIQLVFEDNTFKDINIHYEYNINNLLKITVLNSDLDCSLTNI